MKCLSLSLWILVFELVSFLIGTATQTSVDGWYKSLTQPPLVPPNIVFPIVWTTLYALIAAAGWSLWNNRAQSRRGLILFSVYMLLNWSWSFVFFSMHLLLTGFLWIGALNIISVLIIVTEWNKNRLTAALMIAPTAWTFFACYLNAGFWWLNS